MTHRMRVRHEKMYFSQVLPTLLLVSHLDLRSMNVRTMRTNMSSARMKEPIATVPKWYHRVMLKELHRGDRGNLSRLPLA